MTCKPRKARKPLQESFLYIWMCKSRVKHSFIFGQISPQSSKIKRLQNQIGRFQNISKRHYQNRRRLNIAKLVNTKVAKIMKYQPHGGSNHSSYPKSNQIEKERCCLSYQTVLTSLACQFQHLNVSQIKISVKNIAKVLSLYINAPIRG